jgi:hypothetical protein
MLSSAGLINDVETKQKSSGTSNTAVKNRHGIEDSF